MNTQVQVYVLNITVCEIGVGYMYITSMITFVRNEHDFVPNTCMRHICRIKV